MIRDRDILTTLRSLDAAGTDIDPRGARARADLASILAADAPVTSSSQPLPRAGRRSSGQPPRGRRTAWKLVLAGGAVTAVAATAVVMLPSMTGGDHAFATWTPRPDSMPSQARAKAAAACRDAQKDGPGREYANELRKAQPVIVERRGVWTTVVLAGRAGTGFSAMCVTDGSARLFDAWFGSIGNASGRTPPGPRGLVATDLGVGGIDAGDLSLAAGEAGSQVVKVTYDSRTRGTVTATVSQGRFALWFPGNELRNASNGVHVKVTYKDGTTGTTRLHL
ncbi:hypothetical protein ACFVH6_05425 [Spirillospora sp. NPDC127200]